MKRFIKGCAVVVGLLVAMSANAAGQLITTFDANGKIIPGATPLGGTPPQFNTKAGTWGPASGAGNVAGVSVGRNVVIGAAEGAYVGGKLPALLKTEFTAASIAGGGIKLLRGGIAGVAVGVALDLALQEAHLTFDAIRDTMIYNPPSQSILPPGNGGYWSGGDGSHQGDAGTAILTGCPPGACHIDGPITYRLYDANGVPHGANGRVCGNAEGDGCNIMGASYTDGPTPPSSGPQTCPNGVQFNNTTQCKQPVTDGVASGYLESKVNNINGWTIGQNIQGGGGTTFQPDTGVIPSGNPIPYDTNSWPQATTQPNLSFGPDAQTSTQTTTSTTGSTATTTTTTTNTTNLTNVSVGPTITTNIVNNQQIRICDPAGVCTNSSSSGQPGDSTKPADDEKIKVCGLPNTPACLIDEKGTKEAAQPGIDISKSTKDAWDARIAALNTTAADGNNIGGVGIPGLSSYQAPTLSDHPAALNNVLVDGSSCSPLSPGYKGMSLDYCPVVTAIRPLIDWFAAALTAFALWGIWTGHSARRREA